MSKSALCPLPFNQLFLQSSGKVFPCTFLQNRYPLGDVKEETLLNIWNGEKARKFRKDHIAGNCQACEENKKLFGCHLLQEGMRQSTRFDQVDGPPLKRLDFMIDSFCNLKCIMCTNIYEDRGGFEDESFWIDSEKHIFPHLKEVEIIGGEPFLSKDTYRLIQSVQSVNPHCKWVITTNGAYNLSPKIIQVLRSLDLRLLAFSLDSIREDSFNHIRVGGSLKQCQKTFEAIVKLREQEALHFDIELNMVLQQKNAYEAIDIMHYCDHLKISPYFILLKYPTNHSIFVLPSKEQAKIFTYYFQSYNKGKDRRLLSLLLKLYSSIDRDAQRECFESYASLV